MDNYKNKTNKIEKPETFFCQVDPNTEAYVVVYQTKGSMWAGIIDFRQEIGSGKICHGQIASNVGHSKADLMEDIYKLLSDASLCHEIVLNAQIINSKKLKKCLEEKSLGHFL